MAIRTTRRVCRGMTVSVFATCLALGAGAAPAAQDDDCAEVAAAQFSACGAEANDDYYVAQAICFNGSDEEEDDCIADARAERVEARALCAEQRTARNQLCVALGGGRYDPDFTPANFDDDFTDLTNPNPHFPLGIGSHWEFAGGGETVVIEVLDKTKLIEGVTCLVVNDRVEIDGLLVEDTADWFAQRKDGTVMYCGEEVKDFETFEGDDPQEAELVSIDGSFKAGRDGALPGTQFLASPSVGDVYRQELSLGNAEDAARVLSTSYGFGDGELDAFVPEDLAEHLCDDDCVVTLEFQPIDPTAFARKYYAKGVGQFLEVNLESGEIVQLVECNVHPKCNSLPTP